MVKQTKSRKTENFGKGKVTSVQIAFIVDRYLFDNNFTQTRSTFRTEASDLISKSAVQEAPKSLLSLGAMLDEYICLKEQRVLMDQEKYRLEQENIRVQTLLRGMQDAMNAYNGIGNTPPQIISSMAPKSATLASQTDLPIGFSPSYPMYNTPIIMSASKPPNGYTDPKNFSTPITTHPTSKRRKNSKDVLDALIATKRSRSHSINTQLPVKGNDTLLQSSHAVNVQENNPLFSAIKSSPHDEVPNKSPVQGSSVAKCLFNKPIQSNPNKASSPKTPPRATSSQTEKSISPLEISSTATSIDNVTPQQVVTVLSSEAIKVSPAKQIAYYSIERNHSISISPVKTNLKRLGKRDHIKGRLDFDVPMNSNTPLAYGTSECQSNRVSDVFDLDLPNLDALGADFSFSDLLLDFDLDGEGIDHSGQPSSDSPNSLSGSPDGSLDVNSGTNQVFSEFSSTMTEILTEKDMNIQGPDSVRSMKSITKCIKILSPVKKCTGTPLDQENLSARN